MGVIPKCPHCKAPGPRVMQATIEEMMLKCASCGHKWTIETKSVLFAKKEK